MARPVSSIPKPVFHKPSGQLRVRIKGVDFYCGPWGSPAANLKYSSLIGEFAATGQAPKPANIKEPSELTINELIALYWRQHVLVHYANAFDRISGSVFSI